MKEGVNIKRRLKQIFDLKKCTAKSNLYIKHDKDDCDSIPDQSGRENFEKIDPKYTHSEQVLAKEKNKCKHNRWKYQKERTTKSNIDNIIG